MVIHSMVGILTVGTIPIIIIVIWYIYYRYINPLIIIPLLRLHGACPESSGVGSLKALIFKVEPRSSSVSSSRLSPWIRWMASVFRWMALDGLNDFNGWL